MIRVIRNANIWLVALPFVKALGYDWGGKRNHHCDKVETSLTRWYNNHAFLLLKVCITLRRMGSTIPLEKAGDK
jgi:hypothetical protein